MTLVPEALVLIDADSTINALSISIYLQGYLLATQISPDWPATQRLLKDQAHDIVLIDRSDTASDMVNLAHEARELTSVPIILIAASPDQELNIKNNRPVSTEYFIKPVSGRALIKCVRQLL